jgi:hypothetical protein
MAHLKRLETRRDPAGRASAKIALVRRLYGLGYGRQEIVNLYRFVDWLMRLPRELEDEVWRQIVALEEVQRMPYITTAEWIGLERGRAEGLHEGLLKAIELGLELKFGADGLRLLGEVRQLEDPQVLEALCQRLRTAATLEEIRHVYRDRA